MYWIRRHTPNPNQICNLLYVVPHTNFPNKILVYNLLDVASHTQIITSKNITYWIWYHKTNPNQIYNLLHVVSHLKFLNQIYNLLDMMPFNQIVTKYRTKWKHSTILNHILLNRIRGMQKVQNTDSLTVHFI